MSCEDCPDMRPGSSFDGRHLYCERHRVWTNLLSPKWRGHCLDDWGGSEQLQMDFGSDGREF